MISVIAKSVKAILGEFLYFTKPLFFKIRLFEKFNLFLQAVLLITLNLFPIFEVQEFY